MELGKIRRREVRTKVESMMRGKKKGGVKFERERLVTIYFLREGNKQTDRHTVFTDREENRGVNDAVCTLNLGY